MADPFESLKTSTFPDLPKLHSVVEVISQRIEDQVRSFEKELNDGEEVQLWCNSPAGPMLVTNVGYHSIHLMVLYGATRDGEESKMLVAPTALQLQIVKRRIPAGTNRRAIGFSGNAV